MFQFVGAHLVDKQTDIRRVKSSVHETVQIKSKTNNFLPCLKYEF